MGLFKNMRNKIGEKLYVMSHKKELEKLVKELQPSIEEEDSVDYSTNPFLESNKPGAVNKKPEEKEEVESELEIDTANVGSTFKSIFDNPTPLDTPQIGPQGFEEPENVPVNTPAPVDNTPKPEPVENNQSAILGDLQSKFGKLADGFGGKEESTNPDVETPTPDKVEEKEQHKPRLNFSGDSDQLVVNVQAQTKPFALEQPYTAEQPEQVKITDDFTKPEPTHVEESVKPEVEKKPAKPNPTKTTKKSTNTKTKVAKKPATKTKATTKPTTKAKTTKKPAKDDNVKFTIAHLKNHIENEDTKSFFTTIARRKAVYSGSDFTVKDLMTGKMPYSESKIRTQLGKLVDLGILSASKQGRTNVYSIKIK